MDCLRKKISLCLSVLIISSIMLLIIPSQVFAITYTSISLSPSTGTIWADSTSISVYANSGTDDFAGVDLDVDFTGDVEYISSTGASVCGTFLVTEGTGTINIECLSMDEDVYSGIIATLYFKSSGTGTSVFTLTNGDSSVTVGTLTGGTYTLSTENNPGGAGAVANYSEDDNDDLPDSGIFDNSRNTIIFGVFLLVVGLLWGRINDFAYNTLGKMKENIRETREKRKDERIEKKRKRWEDKF